MGSGVVIATLDPQYLEHLRLPSHSVFNEETCTLNFINLVVRDN